MFTLGVPLRGGQPVATNIPLSNLVLLCHFDGSNGATTTVDSSLIGRTITMKNGAKISTAQSVFGGSSLLLDGVDDYCTAPTSSDFSLGSGDFGMSAWVRQTGGAQVIAAEWNTGGAFSWMFGIDVSDRLFFYYSTDGTTPNFTISSNPSVITSGVQTHVEVDRVGNVLSLYIGGVQVYSAAFSVTIFGAAALLTIGGKETGGGSDTFLTGHIDELAIRKGAAINTAAFTPPTLPYVAV